MDEKLMAQWLTNAEPVPFSVGDFASQTGISRATVERLIATGKIEVVTVDGIPRIPFSVYEQCMPAKLEQTVRHQKEIRLGLAFALETGLIVERGLNHEGAVIYRRVAQQ
jgi:hypothetical protein